jgi:hypothetical protein
MRVIGKRFELNDKHVSIIGEWLSIWNYLKNCLVNSVFWFSTSFNCDSCSST